MIKYPGLPFLSLEIYKLHASGIQSAQLLRVFHFVKFFRKRDGEPSGLDSKKESGTLYRKICMLLYTYCISCGG